MADALHATKWSFLDGHRRTLRRVGPRLNRTSSFNNAPEVRDVLFSDDIDKSKYSWNSHHQPAHLRIAIAEHTSREMGQFVRSEAACLLPAERHERVKVSDT